MEAHILTESMITRLPAQGDAGAWVVRVTPERAESMRALLSDDEREDVERLARESDRAEACVSRGLWRQAAGLLLGVTPDQVMAERTSFGRPVPEGLERTKGDLSTSHADGLVAMVVGRGVRVGIDVERTAGASIDDAVQQAVEGVTGIAMDTVADRAERVLFAWSVLEALMKADGRGMHLHPSMVTADMRTLWGWNSAQVAGTRWWVRRIVTPVGYVGALACGSPLEAVPVEALD